MHKRLNGSLEFAAITSELRLHLVDARGIKVDKEMRINHIREELLQSRRELSQANTQLERITQDLESGKQDPMPASA